MSEVSAATRAYEAARQVCETAQPRADEARALMRRAGMALREAEQDARAQTALQELTALTRCDETEEA